MNVWATIRERGWIDETEDLFFVFLLPFLFFNMLNNV